MWSSVTHRARSVELVHLADGNVKAGVVLYDLIPGHPGQASVYRVLLYAVERVQLHHESLQMPFVHLFYYIQLLLILDVVWSYRCFNSAQSCSWAEPVIYINMDCTILLLIVSCHMNPRQPYNKHQIFSRTILPDDCCMTFLYPYDTNLWVIKLYIPFWGTVYRPMLIIEI